MSWKSASQQRYYTEHRDELRAAMKQRYAKNKRRYGNSRLVLAYGITEAQYQEMLEAQDGKCALCLRVHKSAKKRMSTDHDHSTGKVRGLLCDRCNIFVGWWEANDVVRANLQNYVRRGTH